MCIVKWKSIFQLNFVENIKSGQRCPSLSDLCCFYMLQDAPKMESHEEEEKVCDGMEWLVAVLHLIASCVLG